MFELSETYVALCPQEMKAKFNKCVYQEMLLICKEALLKVPRRLPKLKWIHCCITITPNLFVLRVQESSVKWMMLLKVILRFRKLVQTHSISLFSIWEMWNILSYHFNFYFSKLQKNSAIPLIVESVLKNKTQIAADIISLCILLVKYLCNKDRREQ